MKIDDRFEIERDVYCWQLHDYRMGKTRAGQPKRVRRTTYHPNLIQVSEAILDRMAGTCSELSEIQQLFKEQTDRIVAAIEKAKRDVINLDSSKAIKRAA